MEQIRKSLTESLQGVTEFLQQVTEADWKRPQDSKWTIAEEVDHILIANAGTSRLLSTGGRTIWRAGDHASRTFQQIKEQYLAGLAANPGVSNPTTHPSAESNEKTIEQQLADWQQMTTALLLALDNISADDLDRFTVWKHPFLGPFTLREMLYFTDYHTRHHHQSLVRKQALTN